MNQIEKQCKITRKIPIMPTVNHFLHQQYDTFENETKTNFQSIGGITKDLKYAWIVNGPKFQVIEVENGSRIASWLFGGILRDKRTRITCVTELSNNIGSPPLFVIGLDCETAGGMICIFNIMGSKIMRTIQLDDRVCNLHIVDSIHNIPGILKNLDGVLVVGTCGGDTYLIDLCKQTWINDNTLDEMNYNKLFKRSCSQINAGLLESYRTQAVQNNEHLALQLNVSTNSLFLLSTPQGTDALQLPRANVRVSSFLYVPKLISLLVGYNFGAWQIYNLLTLELEYTSPVYDEIVPVSYFAYQEPSDDPRAFCYVWVVYSDDVESKHVSVPLAAMYALAYESKDHIEYYGVLYQNFISCSLRFQMDLLPINSKTRTAKGGHCISLQTCMINSSNNNCDNPCDHNLTLCMIVWSVYSEDDDQERGDIVMAIIDLDQWYKEQMPATLRDHGNECYIAQFDLSRILNTDGNQSIFNVNIDPTSINPFTTVQRLEEHYYPTALTFDTIVMQKNEFTLIKTNGLQRTLLLTLEQNSVNSFLNAQSFVRQCAEAGLHSICSSDILSPKLKSQQMTSPHTQLLSLALEHNLIGLLTSCAEEWATGAYTSAGCTLGVFVEWATQRSEMLQQKANELCISLFDYSDINLDCNARKILNQCAIQMHHLSSVFKLIQKNCTEYLNVNAATEINEQLRAIQMFSDRLEVLQWLLNIGLLPEAPIKSYTNSIRMDDRRIRAPYPAQQLYQIYNRRRSQLHEEDTTSTISKNKSCELLFIDNLIEEECGGARLRNEWRCDTNTNGLYPPASIQALLRTYLIDNIDLKFKHTILMYVFLDLAVTLDQTKYESIITHLIKFPAVFRLTPCHIKMTQAFWQLDHGDFTTGMEQLLDPLIGGGTAQDEFKPWQHRTVLRTLLANKQYKYAALYIQIRQPPFIDLDEIVNAMHLLLSNNMLHAAFEFQRRHQTLHNKSIILEKFFEGCLQENLITSALKLSLSQDEEENLIKVLRRHNKEDIKLELIYYLQRSRGFDVLRVGDKYYHDQRATKMGLIGQNSLQLPQILLNTYATVMPHITKRIYDDFRTEIIQKKLTIVNKVQTPIPMSVKRTEVNNKLIKCKSNNIVHSINKIRETWSLFNGHNDQNCLESTPFLCTPKRKIHEYQSVTPVTYPNVIYQDQVKNIKKRVTTDDDDDVITTIAFNEQQHPSKRFRYDSNETLSDIRLITSSPSSSSGPSVSVNNHHHTAPERLLLTPIVKRKYSESPSKSLESTSVSSNLPSILKIRTNNCKTNITRDRSITPKLKDHVDLFKDEEEEEESSPSSISSSSTNTKQNESLSGSQRNISSKEKVDDSYVRSTLGATPRKNLIRTPRPVVHFEEASSTENITQTPETVTDNSLTNRIETRSSKKKKNQSSVDTSEIHYTPEECELREEEMISFARKLSRISSPSSPYKSIKPRKSLQRTVLESSLVKNITPVLKRSKHVNRRASANVYDDDIESNETDNDSFVKNVTICSSPTSGQDDVPSKTDNHLEMMEEKYGHATSSSFSSKSNDDSVRNENNMVVNDDSVVNESLIKRMNDKYSDDSSTFENYSIEFPKLISTKIGDIVVETTNDGKIHEVPFSFKTSNEIISSSTNIMENIDDSLVTENFIKRMEAKYSENNPNDTTNTIPEESTLEMLQEPDESCATSNLKQEQDDSYLTEEQPAGDSYLIANSKIIDDKINEKSKSVEISPPPPTDTSVVTQSFIEHMENKFDCEEEVSTCIDERNFECPKMIAKRLGDMIVETIDPVPVDIDEILSTTNASTSIEMKSTLYEDDDSLVTDSLILRMEQKYHNYKPSTSYNASIPNSTTSTTYNSVDTNKESDVTHSNKETSSVYCSLEEIIENQKNVLEEEVLVSEDDYSFRMEVDDDNDEEVDEQDNNCTSSKESSTHGDDSDDNNSEEEEESSEDESSDHNKEEQDPNEIVEISSDDDDDEEKNSCSPDDETEESNQDEENNIYDSNNEIVENDPIDLNECIVFEENSSNGHLSNEKIIMENVNEIIEISEITEVDVYQDLEVAVEIPEDNQQRQIDDNSKLDKAYENIEIFDIQQKELPVESIEINEVQQNQEQDQEESENQAEEINKTIEMANIQQNDVKLVYESENEIKVVMETNENQQQIENQNESNENLLLLSNKLDDVLDEQTQNCNIIHLENQEENNIGSSETSKRNLDMSEIPTTESIPESETHNEEQVVTTSECSKERVQNESKSVKDSELNTIHETDENQSEKENIEQLMMMGGVKTRRRTRQNSVDSSKSETPLPVVKKPPLRRTRATSIDVTSPSLSSTRTTTQKRITRSTSDMNLSSNQNQSKVMINSKSIDCHSKDTDADADKSIIEEYSTSRRLTRKQKSMLEKIEFTNKILPKEFKKNQEDIGPIIEKIDPIKLLDKQTFDGPADPDEQKLLLNRSPASSIKTTSSLQSVDNVESPSKVRNLRSRSIDLDTTCATNKIKLKSSSSSDIVGITTPKRRMSRRLSQLSLNQSCEKEHVSESGNMMSTRAQNSIAKHLKDVNVEVRRSPRRSSRFGSPQSTKSSDEQQKGPSIKTTRRSILQSDLPIISEETIDQQNTKKRKDTEEHVDSPAKRNPSKMDMSKKLSKEDTKTAPVNCRKKL